jgi:putative oxidoreductase
MMFRVLLNTRNSISCLLLRLALGVVMFPHGAQKVFGWWNGPGFEQTLQAFEKMGFPAWATVLLMVVELPGAILLAAGFLTRLWALCIGVSMAICMFLIHVPNGFFMNWFGQQRGEGFEFHILALGICLALLIEGGGALSIDRALAEDSDKGRYDL